MNIEAISSRVPATLDSPSHYLITVTGEVYVETSRYSFEHKIQYQDESFGLYLGIQHMGEALTNMTKPFNDFEKSISIGMQKHGIHPDDRTYMDIIYKARHAEEQLKLEAKEKARPLSF